MQAFPRFAVDFGLESGFKRLVGIARSQKVGMAHKERFFVIVGVDKPTRNGVRIIAAHFARGRIKDIHALDRDLNPVIGGIFNDNIRFAKNDEEIALARIFEVGGHMQVGVHARLENPHRAEAGQIAGGRIVVEGAGNKQFKTRLARFPCRCGQILAGDAAEFRPDEDGRPPGARFRLPGICLRH